MGDACPDGPRLLVSEPSIEDRRMLSYDVLAFVISLLGVTANLLCSPHTLLVWVLSGNLFTCWLVGVEADGGSVILFLRLDSCDRLRIIGLLFSFLLLLLLVLVFSLLPSTTESVSLLLLLFACLAAY